MQKSLAIPDNLAVPLRRCLCFALVVLLSGQLLGCAWSKTKEEKTARELAEEAVSAFKGKDYKEALELFEKLRDWYPFSQYAVLAELKLGDAHYHRKEYEEAIFAYEEFENLHPRNEAVPYVIYQTGRCSFDRLHTIDRDQTMAREALKTFERLIDSYPDSPFTKDAEAHIKVCNRHLAEHAFYVGMFYYKGKHYEAALERFKTVVRSYPDLGVHYEALQHIALCQSKIKGSERAGK